MVTNPITFIGATCVGLLSAYFAKKRGQNPYLWFVIGFFLGICGVFAILLLSGRLKKKAPVPKPVPILTLQGPTDKFWYYLDPQQQKQGPISRDAVNSAWKQGKIHAGTYVWHEDLTEWKVLKEMLKEI